MEARLLEAGRLRRETEARQRAEEQARLLAEQQRIKQEAEARQRAEEQAQARAQRLRQEAEARQRAEEQARVLAEQEQVREEAEALQRAEEQARALAERLRQEAQAEARQCAEEQARLLAEQQRIRQEAEARQRAEEQARLLAEQQRIKQEAEARQRAEEQAQALAERLRQEAQAEACQRAEEQARLLAEQQRIKQETESRQRGEEETRAMADEDVVVESKSAQPDEVEVSGYESTSGSTFQAKPVHAILENESQVSILPIDEPSESERTEIPKMQSASVDAVTQEKANAAYSPLWNFTAPVATPRRRMPLVIAGVGVISLGIVLAVLFLIKGERGPEPPPPTEQPSVPVAPKGMVYIPGGEFLMGNDGRDEYEKPSHKATVNSFFMDTYEVTCEDYQKFIKATGHKAPPGWKDGTYPSAAARQPVTGVDWNDASAYALWVHKRLPTEEEWELAARGTTGARYPWGNDWKSGVANANGARKGLADVGSYKDTSPFGLFDMVGNAWEWTSSSIHSYPGGAVPEDKLTQAARDKIKVLRGGCYLTNNLEATTTYRSGWPASGSNYDQTGFRCAQDVPR